MARKSLISRAKKMIKKGKSRAKWRRKCQSLFSDAVINNKKVIFSCFAGRQYSDSPKAIYEAMLSDDRFSDFEFIWAFKKPQDYAHVEALGDRRNRIVKLNTDAFLRELYSAKYWVLNYKTTNTYLKRPEQVYVQCWHGTPLKKLGRDIMVEGNSATKLNKIHESYLNESRKFNYFISPSRYATSKFVTSFGLDVLNKEDIILESGYPRNDALSFCTEGEIASIKERLNIPSDKKVLLYCPTFRDNQYKAGVGHTYNLGVNLLRLKDSLSDRFVLLMRLHYLVSNKIDMGQFTGFVYDVSAVDDVNDLYKVADMLITDYSSVFFDYAVLQRPILFYMYDLDEYQTQLRDFYLDLSELPGDIICNERDLIDYLNDESHFNVDEDRLNTFKDKFCYLEDGNASKRVINEVFADEIA